jgi:hypothetical protein
MPSPALGPPASYQIPFSKMPSPALGPTASYQMCTRLVTQEWKDMGMMKLATHLHPVQVIKCMELYLHFFVYLHDEALNEAQDDFTFHN